VPRTRGVRREWAEGERRNIVGYGGGHDKCLNYFASDLNQFA
jgi:hypothetical protein